ncbi:purple acid phosphatase family protein [Streptomyces celluloflavus]|uniref:Purple acid phosphatase family protein n=1 Tax=Streptomyces celluloflavus TaxID=58344 RepID=A0ABW7RI16_9ACTN
MFETSAHGERPDGAAPSARLSENSGSGPARPVPAEQHERPAEPASGREGHATPPDGTASRHSRRGILRIGASGGAAWAAGTVLLPGGAAAAVAEPRTAPAAAAGPAVPSAVRTAGSALRPFGRHINFGADPARQMVVSWQVPAAVADPFIRIGLNPGDLGNRVRAEVRPLVSKLAWQHPVEDQPLVKPKKVTQYHLHAALDHLVPDTTYYYVVGHRGYDPVAQGARLGEVASFRTAPAPGHGGAFTFTAFGDQGIGYNAAATSNLIAGLDPAFHLHMGDLCYANTEGGGTRSDKYDARVWDSFFVQNEPVSSRTPWMISMGNHEMEAWYGEDGYGGMRARYAMPDNAWERSTGIYSWRYQNVGLLSLDGNDVCFNTPANLDYTRGKQTPWLRRRLAAFRADPTIDFIVVYFHQCTYSTCHDNGAELGAQQDWAPLFDRYQVDLVLNGHNHVYERTDPIRGGKATRKLPSGGTTDPVADGTTYVVAGGGGGGLYKFPVGDTYLGHEKPNDEPVPMVVSTRDGHEQTVKVEWSRVRYTGYGLVTVDVTPAAAGRAAQLKVRCLIEDGSAVDEFTVRRGRRGH